MAQQSDQAPESDVVPAQVVEKLLLTSKEACAALGMTRDKLFHLRKRGVIPFVKVSERRYYYPYHELRAWIAANCHAAEVAA
jgi:excisionase family DNA binding protein